MILFFLLTTDRKLLETGNGSDLDCIPSGIHSFPEDFFTQEERQKGGVLVHFLILAYICAMIAIVCDVYFIPSLDIIADKLHLPPDVAGATFMAIGASSPELFSSIIGSFVTEGDIGVGAVIGSAVFNILGITGVAGIALWSQQLDIDWYPITRDCVAYSITVFCLVFIIYDSIIKCWESVILLGIFLLYILLMYFNTEVENFVRNLAKRIGPDYCCCRTCREQAEKEEKEPLLNGKVFVPEFVASQEKPKMAPADNTTAIVSECVRVKDAQDYEKIGCGDPFPTRFKIYFQQIQDPFISNKIQDPFIYNKIQDPFISNEIQDPFISNEIQDPFISNEIQDPFISNEIQDPFISNEIQDPFISNEIQDPFISNEIQDPFISNEIQDPFISNEIQDPFIFNEIQDPFRTIIVSSREEEEEEEESSGLCSPPRDSVLHFIWWLVMLPASLLLAITIPDSTNSKCPKVFPLTFLLSIAWLGVLSYMAVWMVTIIGYTLSIPDSVSGLTILAVGASVPDLISSVLVAKSGKICRLQILRPFFLYLHMFSYYCDRLRFCYKSKA
ncbi:hypothetical protein TNIN_436131 [Trichonephila inaurata madagascariensis]|uniref:Sodium/calcium exchanger membrane region domain-containing protein n=1 Tax=Trichonephila inaurata madagascariensis TaxID=2747483 RepID=A0A8X6YGU0_9ARAC|nr:hypothetical protein TNIN_436131 [Trichonephila inaurata madagascariensis]